MPPQEDKNDHLGDILENVSVFKALGEDPRAKIFCLIAVSKKPLNVSDVCARVTISQGTVSRHLSILHRAGCVTRERYQNQVFYALDPKIIDRLQRICTALKATFS